MNASRWLFALALVGCRRDGASTTPNDDAVAASSPSAAARRRAPLRQGVRIAHFTCVTLDGCVDPIRKGLAPLADKVELLGAPFAAAFQLDAPAGVWVFAMPGERIGVALVLPVRDDEAALQQLAALKLKVEHHADGFTVQGMQGRLGGGRLLLALDSETLDLAEIAPEPAKSRLGAGVLARGELVFERVPAELRARWERDLRARIDSEDGTFGEQTKRATRLESLLDMVRDGERIDVELRTDGVHGLSVRFATLPRPGTWLADYVAANTSLRSKLPAILPKESPFAGAWFERNAFRDEDKLELAAQLDTIAAAGPELGQALGVPKAANAEFERLLAATLTLARQLFGGVYFESAAFVPATERSFVFALRGLDPANVDAALSAGVELLAHFSGLAVTTARTRKVRGTRLHEIVMPAGSFTEVFGQECVVAATVADDVLLVRVAGDDDPKTLLRLKKQLARAPMVDVSPRELHLDIGAFVPLFGTKAAVGGALLGIRPGVLRVDMTMSMQGPAMVTDVAFDLTEWIRLVARTIAMRKPAAPK